MKVLEAAYRAILGREPDQTAIENYGRMLEQGTISVYDFIKTLLDSEEHLSKIQKRFIEDHSQYGEFRKILNLLLNDNHSKRIVVDVGARGRERSNSYDLMRNFGWKGLLVEANPSLYEQITSEFSDLDFELVISAVGLQKGKASLYTGINEDVSSLISDATSSWGQITGKMQVDVNTLKNILDLNGVRNDFDVLSLDIEGLDTIVLNDLIKSSDYRPHYIIIETSNNFQNTTMESAGLDKGVCAIYEIACQTEANMILRRRFG